MAASGFLTKPVQTNFEENHFSVEFFSEISYKLFLSLCCSVSTKTPSQVFAVFVFLKHGREVSRTQSSIKMIPINDSRGVFKTKWNI